MVSVYPLFHGAVVENELVRPGDAPKFGGHEDGFFGHGPAAESCAAAHNESRASVLRALPRMVHAMLCAVQTDPEERFEVLDDLLDVAVTRPVLDKANRLAGQEAAFVESDLRRLLERGMEQSIAAMARTFGRRARLRRLFHGWARVSVPSFSAYATRRGSVAARALTKVITFGEDLGRGREDDDLWRHDTESSGYRNYDKEDARKDARRAHRSERAARGKGEMRVATAGGAGDVRI